MPALCCTTLWTDPWPPSCCCSSGGVQNDWGQYAVNQYSTGEEFNELSRFLHRGIDLLWLTTSKKHFGEKNKLGRTANSDYWLMGSAHIPVLHHTCHSISSHLMMQSSGLLTVSYSVQHIRHCHHAWLVDERKSREKKMWIVQYSVYSHSNHTDHLNKGREILTATESQRNRLTLSGAVCLSGPPFRQAVCSFHLADLTIATEKLSLMPPTDRLGERKALPPCHPLLPLMNLLIFDLLPLLLLTSPLLHIPC